MKNVLQQRDEGTLEVLRNPSQLAIVTATYYPSFGTSSETPTDALRAKLALQALKKAKEKGYHVFVSDRGNSEAFIAALREVGIDVTIAEAGTSRAESKRQLYHTAAGTQGVKAIAWMEPEKISFIEDDCVALAAGPIIRGEADIVTPKREEASWQTYPDYQAASEQQANKRMNAILRAKGILPKIGQDMEFFFGPVLLANKPEVLALFDREYQLDTEFQHRPRGAKAQEVLDTLAPDDYMNAMIFPVVDALAEGMKVETVVVPYRHPQEQTESELSVSQREMFIQKRKEQRFKILSALCLKLFAEKVKERE